MDVVHKTLKTINEKTSVARFTIDNFFAYVNNRTQYLDSEPFALEGFGTKFYLRVWLYSGGTNCLHYRLFVDDMADEKSIQVSFKFWLENNKSEKCAETQAKNYEFQQNGDYDRFDDVLTQNQLLSKAAFFGSGSATVCCEMTYKVSVDGLEPPKINHDVCKGLWKSYQQGLCDAVTIQVENKQFKVPKNVLAANSPVFERMFLTTACKEVQTGIVEIKDTKATVIEALIEYMHCGTVENLEPIAIELFKVADKYDVQPLKELCGQSIGKSLNASNLFEIVVMAYMYNSEHLKYAIWNFLSANRGEGHFTELTASNEWFDFIAENRQLAHEIIKDVTGKMGVNI